MAKKRVAAIVKIQIPAGAATPAPPVGTALGPHGVNIMDFCKLYNAQTESQRGTIIPAEITIFEDRSFTFITKTPPTPVLLRAAAGIDKGAQTTGREVVGTHHRRPARPRSRETKMPDLNANDLEAAKKQVAGTARSMGIKVQLTWPRERSTPTPPGTSTRSRSTRRAEAVDLVKSVATAKFDETVELAVRLGVDPRKADQIVRGTVALPAGTGQGGAGRGVRRRRRRPPRRATPGPTSSAPTTWSRRCRAASSTSTWPSPRPT